MKKALISLGLTMAALSPGFALAGSWTKLGQIPGGNFGRIAVDPNNPMNVLIGAEGGGLIFKSKDGGLNYTKVSVGTIDEGFRGIAIDPANSDIVLAIGRDQVNVTQAYVYKSVDGGGSWKRLAHQPGNGQVILGWSVVFDEAGKTVMIGDSRYGIYRSTDLGNSWAQVLVGKVRVVSADPNDPKTFWAGGLDSINDELALWKSIDGGTSWSSIKAPADGAGSYPSIFAIAALPNSKIVLAEWSGFTSSSIGGVIASHDGGMTWTDSSAGLPVNDFASGDAMAVDPTVPTTVYATTGFITDSAGLYKSTDSGTHWKALENLGGTSAYAVTARPAGHGLPPTILAAGANLFQSTDHGKNWVRSSGGVAIGTLLNVVDDHLSAKGIYGSVYDGLFHSSDGGATWTRTSTWTGDSAPIDFDVDSLSTKHDVYVLTHDAIRHSADAGQSWNKLPLPSTTANLQHIFIDRVKPGRIYAYGYDRALYRSDDAARHWTKFNVVAATAHLSGYPLAFDGTKSGIIYAPTTIGLLKSTDGGGTWRDTKIVGTPAPVSAAAVSQGGSSASLLGVVNGVLERSSDGGKTWQTAAQPFGQFGSVSSVIAQPESQNIFAVGYNNELAETKNGGISWSMISTAISPTGFWNIAATAENLYLSSGSGGTSWVRPVP